jgi:hypothetical protein
MCSGDDQSIATADDAGRLQFAELTFRLAGRYGERWLTGKELVGHYRVGRQKRQTKTEG